MVRVNGREFSWREGMTIADLLNELGDSYSYPVVRIRDRLISEPNFKEATVPDNAEVHLIPLIVGG
jgi:thiamine biosynthesis protein ThiS